MLSLNGYKTPRPASRREGRTPLTATEPDTAECRAGREAPAEARRLQARQALAAKGVCAGTAPDVRRPLPAACAQAAVVSCPSCGQALYAPAAWAGQAVSCPRCRKVMTVPEVPAPPPDAPARRVIVCPSCKIRGTAGAGQRTAVCPRCRWRFAIQPVGG